MILSPKEVYERQILSEIKNPNEQLQQNGIDLTLKSIKKLAGWNNLTNNERSHCERLEVEAPEDGIITLQPGSYEVIYNELFNIPNGIAAMILTRSTIIRGGNFIASGLYDAGFNNYGGGVLHVHIPLKLELGVRVAQAVFFLAEQGDLYKGIYNNYLTANENTKS